MKGYIYSPYVPGFQTDITQKSKETAYVVVARHLTDPVSWVVAVYRYKEAAKERERDLDNIRREARKKFQCVGDRIDFIIKNGDVNYERSVDPAGVYYETEEVDLC
jgi:hypothetical protein